MAGTVIGSGTSARDALYERYADSLETNPDLDRSLVSFQSSKAQPFYGWFKYKEGFSSLLIEYCIRKLTGVPGTLLDPFAGAGSALFASRALGWDTLGIELMPVGLLAVQARLAAEKVSARKFTEQVEKACDRDFAGLCPPGYAFPHITITKGAFPPRTEREIGGFISYCDNEVKDAQICKLFRFACFSILEDVSYTRKDGQYLRWDCRSSRDRIYGDFQKGDIPTFRQAIGNKLMTMSRDLNAVSRGEGLFAKRAAVPGSLEIRRGSCLNVLPTLAPGTVDMVITSPPYCNRYDYTRTYALELAFLGNNASDVKGLRQALLSCTVENKEKVNDLRRFYSEIGFLDRFESAQNVFWGQEALHEVLAALNEHNDGGRLNNSNVPRMVQNYFFEMCLVVLELARILKPGGKMVMVNDNVRYAGEEVPVDLILSDMAASSGLHVRNIWTLPRGKGNSSQQMGVHGRSELRKCVYVWEKTL